MLNGAQAMGNNECGSPGEQTIQGFANQQFRFGVHAGGGFVENQEARIVGERTRKID